jgi:FkbM family methyltransferase
MSLQKTQDDFREGRIDKACYIERMFERHQGLFDYRQLLKGSDIEALSISQDDVRVKFSWPPVELILPAGEMRAAPVEALNFGSYEKREFAVVESLVAGLGSKQPVFIDIGGNVGFYSIGLKRLHPGLRIHAFEPVPATADQFEANCRLNGCSDIVLHRHGLSSARGEAVFHVHPRMSVAASQQNILGGEEMQEVTCQLVPLDEIAGELPGPVDFIKCDVEGAELFAFQGGTALIERDCPIVFSEMLRKWSAKFGYHPDDIIRFFGERGYSCHALGASGSRVIDSVDEGTTETNFIFLHTIRHEGVRLHS